MQELIFSWAMRPISLLLQNHKMNEVFNFPIYTLMRFLKWHFCSERFFYILGTLLRATFSSSKTTTSNITVWWNHPNQDVDLVQSYNVSLREKDSADIFHISVELQTNYTFESSFLPGSLYYFEITSVVYLKDSAETIFVKTNIINLVVGKHVCYFSLTLIWNINE